MSFDVSAPPGFVPPCPSLLVPLLDVEREPLREPGLPDGSLLLELELDGLKGGELEDRARAGTSRSDGRFQGKE